MAKLLLFSVCIMMLALPILAARDKQQQRGFRKLLWFFLLYNVFYLFAVRFIYPHLL